ncbi:MAG: FHA domain-containing protein [Anaerolineae bacterium]
MSAEDPILNINKPYTLTLKGSITVHYLDGQVLNGEILAQDAFNIFLKVEDVPHLIPRQQIRYITGAAGQMPEEETGPLVIVETLPEPAPPPPPAPPEPEPLPSPPPVPAEPEPQVAQFVEEEDLAPVIPNEDSSGTVVLPTITDQMLQAGSETSVSQTLLEEAEDMGRTLVFPPAITPDVPLTDTTERTGLPQSSVAPASTNLADLFDTTSELDGEATFIIGAKAAATVSAHLVCTSGPHAGEVLQLKPGLTTIGRSSDNSFALSKDKEVSRRHAIIAYEANKFVIQDQNSLNHTFVNNEEVKEPRPLADGDLILIGVSTLKFQER